VLAKQVVELGGAKLTEDKAAKLIPNLKYKLLDLVMGYAGSDGEAKDLKNSPSA
jgi:hypothetical protein